ncbi:Ubiquitin fusion degradation protein 4 [Chytridiales sp. JEL 0842]|nr:Ubiquitin fusion degradation protein 4 [Chytridiales sp. JEL 0842]
MASALDGPRPMNRSLKRYAAKYVRNLASDSDKWAQVEKRLSDGQPYTEASFMAVAMIDISGYSSLTSQLVSLGKVASEIITSAVNDFLRKIISTFLGDAALVSFAAKNSDESPQDIVSRAFSCCLDIMRYDSTISINLDGINIVGDQNTFKKQQRALEQASQTSYFSSSSQAAYSSGNSEDNQLILGAHTAITCGNQLQHLIMGLPQTRMDYSLHGEDLFNLSSLLDSSTVGELVVDGKMASYLSSRILEALLPFTKLINFRGEFRKVSVVFVKLAPTTVPENANKIFVAFVKALDKWQGCFGLPPWTFEKDALHAWKAVTEFSTSLEKIGIKDTRNAVASGELLFTELGSSLRGDASLLGDVVNLAARLLSISESAETSVCDKATHDIIMQDVQLSHLGDFKVKGKNEVVPVFGLKKKTAFKSEEQTFMPVGYGPEKTSLEDGYQDWLSGRSSFVGVIEGKSGSGKSTLLQNFVNTITKDKVLCCIAQASQIEQWAPFFSLQNPLEMLIDVFKSQSDQSRNIRMSKASMGSLSSITSSGTVNTRYKRSRSIADITASRNELDERVLLQNMMCAIQEEPNMYTALSCILPNRIRDTKESSATQDSLVRRNAVKDIFFKLFRLLTSQQKMVFIFDDCQWTDLISLEVLQKIVLECSQVCILFFTRPIESEHETMQNILSMEGVLHLKLGGLGVDETEQLIVQKLKQLGNIKGVEPNLLKGALNVDYEDSSVEITQAGILKAKQWETFEETVRKIQNTGAALTQFDRLDDEFKDLLRKASIFGQYFNVTDICESVGESMTVDGCLKMIESMDKYAFLAHQNGMDKTEGEMYFRHISVMNAIYESLPYEQRVDYHLSAAQYFEKQMIEHHAADSLMPIVSYHFSRTSDIAKHIQYLETLAYKNLDRCYYDEAANSLEQLIELSERKDFIEGNAPPEKRAELLDTVRHADWICHYAYTFVTKKVKLHLIPELCAKALKLLGVPWPKSVKEYKSELLKSALYLFFVLWPRTKGGTKVYERLGVKCQYFPAGVVGHNLGTGCQGANCRECPLRQRVLTLSYRSMLIRSVNMPDLPPEGLAYFLIMMCSSEIKTGQLDVGEWVESCHWAAMCLYVAFPGISRKFLAQAELIEKTKVLPRADATASLIGILNFNTGRPETAFRDTGRSLSFFQRRLDPSNALVIVGMQAQFSFWLGRFREVIKSTAHITTWEGRKVNEAWSYMVTFSVSRVFCVNGDLKRLRELVDLLQMFVDNVPTINRTFHIALHFPEMWLALLEGDIDLAVIKFSEVGDLLYLLSNFNTAAFDMYMLGSIFPWLLLSCSDAAPAYAQASEAFIKTDRKVKSADIKPMCQVFLARATSYSKPAYQTLPYWSVPLYQSALQFLEGKHSKAMNNLVSRINSKKSQDSDIFITSDQRIQSHSTPNIERSWDLHTPSPAATSAAAAAAAASVSKLPIHHPHHHHQQQQEVVEGLERLDRVKEAGWFDVLKVASLGDGLALIAWNLAERERKHLSLNRTDLLVALGEKGQNLGSVERFEYQVMKRGAASRQPVSKQQLPSAHPSKSSSSTATATAASSASSSKPSSSSSRKAVSRGTAAASEEPAKTDRKRKASASATSASTLQDLVDSSTVASENASSIASSSKRRNNSKVSAPTPESSGSKRKRALSPPAKPAEDPSPKSNKKRRTSTTKPTEASQPTINAPTRTSTRRTRKSMESDSAAASKAVTYSASKTVEKKSSKKSTIKESVAGGGSAGGRSTRNKKKTGELGTLPKKKKEDDEDDEDEQDDLDRFGQYDEGGDYDEEYYDEDEYDEEVGQDNVSISRQQQRAAVQGIFESMFLGGGVMSAAQRSSSAARFKPLLDNMKSNDRTMQLIALQELSEVLSVATEDMFMGSGGSRMYGFSSEEFVKALIGIVKGPEVGFQLPADMQFMDEADLEALGLGGIEMDNPEVLLLACRCLSNLLEANPSAAMYVTSNGGVDVLVSKLMSIEYIDLAEQVLTVLEKVSNEYPSSIIKANGLLACLQYIDFFGLHVQRTAMTIAANATRGLSIHGDDFPKIKEVIPIIDRLLTYQDSRLVEQAVRCISRVVECTYKRESRLEELLTSDILTTITGLINPFSLAAATPASAAATQGSTNPAIFTQLVRLLTSVCRGSPKLAALLVTDKGLIDIIYNFITGGVAFDQDKAKVSAAVTTSIVNRPVDQLLEVLGLASELLPSLPKEGVWDTRPTNDEQRKKESGDAAQTKTAKASTSASTPAASAMAKHVALLNEKPDIVKSYVARLMPILIEAVGSSVNPEVRRLCVLCVAKAVWYSSKADLLSAMQSSRGFGKFIFELLALQEFSLVDPYASLESPAVDGSGKPPAGPPVVGVRTLPDRERRETLLLMVAGVQIASVAMDKCGFSVRQWLSREGVLFEVQKMMSTLEEFEESEKAKVAKSVKDKAPSSPSRSGADAASSSTSESRSSSPSRGIQDLVKDLKKMTDQVAAQLSQAGDASDSELASLVKQADELVKGTEAAEKSDGADARSSKEVDKSSRKDSDGSPSKPPKINTKSDPDAAESSAGAPSSPTRGASTILAGMRRALEKFTRTNANQPSPSSASPRTPFDTHAYAGLCGEQYTEREIRTWLLPICKDLLKVGEAGESDTASESAVLQVLKTLASVLSGSTQYARKDKKEGGSEADRDTFYVESLQRVAKHLVGSISEDSDIGVTSFELLESGIVEALNDFMTRPGVGETHVNFNAPSTAHHPVPLLQRLRAFLHVFLNAPLANTSQSYYVDGAFQSLVSRLQESLSRAETFDVAKGIPSGSLDSMMGLFGSLFGGSFSFGSSSVRGEVHNPALQLARQIKVKLVAEDPEDAPLSYRNFMISIHAIATIKTVEDFLKAKVGPLTVKSATATSASSSAGTATGETPQTSVAIEPEKPAETPATTTVPTKDEDHDVDVEDNEDDGDEDGMDVDDDGMEDIYDEMDDDEDMDDYDDDDDHELVNVSDILLQSEEAQRQRRRNSFSSRASDTSSQQETHSQDKDVSPTRKRDSVVDVLATSAPATPSPLGAATTSSSPSKSGTSIPAKGRPTIATGAGMSYAGATKASQSAFKIVFYLDGKEVPKDSTIFGLFYRHEMARSEAANNGKASRGSPNIWSNLYQLKFKKVPADTPSPVEAKTTPTVPSFVKAEIDSSLMKVKTPFSLDPPTKLDVSSQSGQILLLLRFLHSMNTRWSEIFEEEEAIRTFSAEMPAVVGAAAAAADGESVAKDASAENAVKNERSKLMTLATLSPSAFVNNKLTAKLNRQLDEPLIVASNVLPTWCSSIAREFSFLVPFETRLLFLQSTSFGFSRSLGRWQQQLNSNGRNGGQGRASDASPQLGRLQRQKVRIGRSRIIDSMMKVMDLYGSTQLLLEVEFFDEVGTGLGPTLEFYSSVCKELRRREGVVLGLTSPKSKDFKGFLPDQATPSAAASAAATEKFNVWRDDGRQGGDSVSEYLNPSGGLFPAPMTTTMLKSEKGRRTIHLFKSIGTFVAKALLDSRIVDMPFSPLLLEMMIGEEAEDRSASKKAHGKKGRMASELHLLKHIDSTLYNSLADLKKYAQLRDAIVKNQSLSAEDRTKALSEITVKGAKLEDLCLDFTMPGYPEIELIPNGSDTPLTLDNVSEYVDMVVELTVGSGVAKQIDAFRSGFNRVFAVSDLRSFSVQELGLLISGNENEDWSIETLVDCIKADHGYTADSRAIRFLVEMMSTYSPVERREFLMFVTGSPKLPIGGFKAFSPPLTVVCKNVETGRKPDDYLPSVMTCVNYLKVPDFSTLEVMKQRFDVAIKEGQGCFHLS